jgi:hypothetical protein
MRIKIGKYKNWFGPYQVAELLCFWAKETVVYECGFKSKPDYVDKFGEFLSNTWLYKVLVWIDEKKKRTVKVHIDKWDTWNMDHTLALIILPMLEQLRETKHGSPYVDDEDVPEYLRKGNEDQLTFEFYNRGLTVDEDIIHKRWEWVLNEMIWAFKEHLDDNADEKFFNNDTHKSKYDHDAWTSWNEKKQNGFRLFGKYYTGLWD